jgi:hypothetical protein
MAVRYAMRSGCAHLAPCHHLRGRKPSNRNHHGVAEAHVVESVNLKKTERKKKMQENPKGAGSKCRARYECYKGADTIATALSAGCRQDDLRLDLKHGFLTLHDPALDSSIAAPGPLASDAGGVVYEEWRHARLVPLPKKKGDLLLFKN